MKKSIVIRWICSAILIVYAFSAIFSGKAVAPILFLLGAAMIIPLKITQELKSKLKLNNVISIVLAVVLFITGIVSIGVSEEIKSNKEDTSHSHYYTSHQTTNHIPSTTSSTSSTTSGTSSQSAVTTTAPFANSTVSGGSSQGTASVGNSSVSVYNVPAYSGSPYIAINNNIPFFTSSELTTTGYENYSALDSLGRVGTATASLGKETMPKEGEERGSISSIYPTGWKQAKYDNISGKYLYNRCHLIGWQLSAENSNKQNLLTGTKYLNVSGMLPFENMVADYIKETNNHVAYRVTPIFEGNNLLASGVQIEAYSVEDGGDGICFNVYCYNVQPGISIDYSNGTSSLDNTAQTTKKQQSTTTTKPSATQSAAKPSTTKPSTTKPSTTKPSTTKPSTTQPNTTKPEQTTASQNTNSQTVYITATGSKYHSRKNCPGLSNANTIYESTLEKAQKDGYTPCKKCH